MAVSHACRVVQHAIFGKELTHCFDELYVIVKFCSRLFLAVTRFYDITDDAFQILCLNWQSSIRA